VAKKKTTKPKPKVYPEWVKRYEVRLKSAPDPLIIDCHDLSGYGGFAEFTWRLPLRPGEKDREWLTLYMVPAEEILSVKLVNERGDSEE
jgi:hypothetical protein